MKLRFIERFLFSLTVILIFLLTACRNDGNGGNTGNNRPSNTTPVTTVATPNSPPIIHGIDESYIVPALETLDIKAIISDPNADELQFSWEQLEGEPLWEGEIASLELNLKMPVDQGFEQIFQIKATVSDGIDESSYITTITVPTSTSVVISDPSDDGEIGTSIKSDIKAEIDSISSRGVLEASKNEFSIALSSNSGAILSFDDELEITLYSNVATKIKHLFAFNESQNLLYIKPENFETFINLLGDEQTDLDLSALDSNGSDISMEITFYFGYGKIFGTLVDQNDNPYPGLESETIELRGGFKGTTYTTKVDDNSRFEFIDLPADTYNLHLVTGDFKVANSAVLLNANNNNINISPRVIDLQNPVAPQTKMTGSLQRPRNTPLKRLQYHNEIKHESLEQSKSACLQEPIDSMTVISAAQGAAVSTTKEVTIPEEITEIKVVVTVTSFEFPEWTTEQSEYNDAWQYNYLVNSQVKSKNGNVNSTHASIGTVRYTDSFDVNQNPDSPPDTVTLSASTTNIADDLVPTSVKLEIFDISDELIIDKFQHKSGLGFGKTNRWHIGISSNSHKIWKTKVNYSPEESELSKADCKFITASNEISIDNIDITVNNPGSADVSMGFSGASASSFLGSTHGKIECKFEATDEEDNTITACEPSSMEMASGKDDLIPLKRYSSGSRYGTRDTGNDDWMRASTIEYMSGKNLIYNDTSREHGGCYVKDAYYSMYNNESINCSQSIRDHSSHRDGLSVDTRYPTTTMNNPTINLRNKLAQSSTNPIMASEVKNWVNKARTEINNIASSDNVRKVYIAKESWLKNLINNGVDENNNLVTGLTAWNNKSSKIHHYPQHSNHIHIEIYP